MVPLRFQTPIRAPTANRMKIALVTDAMALRPASWTALNGCPFRIAMRAASAQQRDLDGTVQGVEAEQGQGARDEDGQRDEGDYGIPERGPPQLLVERGARHRRLPSPPR